MTSTTRSFRSLLAALAVFSVLAAAPTGSAAQPGPDGSAVDVSAAVRHSTVAPGDETAIAVVFDHAEGFHTYPPKPRMTGPAKLIDPLIGVSVTADATGSLEVGDPLFPEAHLIEVPPALGGGGGETYSVYEGRSIVYLPVTVPDDAEIGTTTTLELTTSHQACNDQFCLAPTDNDLSIDVAIGETTQADTGVAELFDGYQQRVEAAAQESAAESADEQTVAGGTAPSGPPAAGAGKQKLLGLFDIDAGLLGLLGLSFLGGLILNLTPCVLPVIPIKVMTLSQHAGESRLRAFWLGLSMAIGVVLFWVALGIPAALVQQFTDPSRVFGLWYVTVPLGVLIIALALGLMGMFSLNLPTKVYMFNPKADSTFGSLLFGVMTGVLGLPCFGFVAGALVPAAASLGQAQVVAIFTSLGVGMAAPYLILSVFPQLLNRVPRTGPASELVKQFLGLLMIAAGIYFAGTGLIALVRTYPYLGDMLHYFGVSAAVAGAAIWLVIGTFRITKKPAPRAVFGVIALLLMGGSAWLSAGEVVERRNEHRDPVWTAYTPDALEQARQQGKVVFVDFTAEWCINCKVFEARVLETDSMEQTLREDWITPMKVDMTGPNPDGSALLDRLGRVGIPTWAVYGPGLDEPYIISSYTPNEVSGAIERARGTTDDRDRVAQADQP